MNELRVLIADEEVATIYQTGGGKLRLVYDDDWRWRADAFPLSLSMPLARAEHKHNTIKNFLWNLLFEQHQAREELGRRFGVSPANPFALIGCIGEDLAGAVQMIPPEKLDALRGREGAPPISTKRLAEHLRKLLQNPGALQINPDAGFFSLAGQQPKKAICYLGGKWYEPRGRTPSTHILKPPAPWLSSPVENEHFCLSLARKAGLRAVHSEVVTIDGMPTILIERYDRWRIKDGKRARLSAPGGTVHRVHQEDLCQAFGVLPERKYEERGGPGMRRIMQLLEGSDKPEEDRTDFMKACAFNYVIAGVDAHAKNYSVLIGDGGVFRLAPLYDVMSALPYDHEHYFKLAMNIGTEGKWKRIKPKHWEREAKACKYPAEKALGHVAAYVAMLPDLASDTLKTCQKAGLTTGVLPKLVDELAARCKDLAHDYAGETLV